MKGPCGTEHDWEPYVRFLDDQGNGYRSDHGWGDMTFKPRSEYCQNKLCYFAVEVKDLGSWGR